ncbi:hypothetical protein H2200_012986 [Cladophialophora chaetospira]|uniref:Uncharacterized protein n=1 Tax=Cladophialophora chaetospira TaxID=386627 RepID=A0AA38WWJ4_9EURO|nr:hypothetical protein H2200_012986 [Cladophialophora chaetospira]
MRFTSYTAAAILAFALAQAGAVPSPQESEAVSADPPAPPTDEPVYYPDEGDDADIEKRDNKKFPPARQYGGHTWKNLGGQGNGPMPDEDFDLEPYLDHPDPAIEAIASVAKRAPKTTKNAQGIPVVDDPSYHWWEQQGAKGATDNPIAVGNPNVKPNTDYIQQTRWGAGLKAREADPDEHGAPGGQAGHWAGGQGGQGMGTGHSGQGGQGGGMNGGHGGQQAGAGGGQPGGMGGGGGPGGAPGGQGGQWGGGGGHGDRGHGPWADEQ